MRKTLLTIALVSLCVSVFAQKGQIIYTDFEPDTTMYFWIGNTLPNPNDVLYVDVDHDGSNEFYIMGTYLDEGGEDYRMTVDIGKVEHSGWSLSPCEPETVIADIPDYDTIHWIWLSSITYWYPECLEWSRYLGLRRQIGSDYYYGWLELSVTWYEDSPWSVHATLSRMAYCTIPNYPLRCGQTSASGNDVEEAESTRVSILPNPGKGIFSITGVEPCHIDVFDAFGQRVSSRPSEATATTIDLSANPAGIYFVVVTDKDGKRFTRKIVKQ